MSKASSKSPHRGRIAARCGSVGRAGEVGCSSAALGLVSEDALGSRAEKKAGDEGAALSSSASPP